MGFYTGISKDVQKFTFSLAARMDKNQNFNFLFSPAASVVYKPSETTIFDYLFSSAIRNPTLSDQYLHLKVGPALLLGNLEGYNHLINLDSFSRWRSFQYTTYQRNNKTYQPRESEDFEIGYRTTFI